MNKIRSIGIVLTVIMTLIPLKMFSAEKIAAILKLKGKVMVKHEDDREYSPAFKGQMLLSGDWIKTGNGDFAALIFLDGTQLKLSEAAELELKSERISAREQNTDLYLTEGKVWTKVQKQKRSDFNIATPVSVAAVKGTEFNLEHDRIDNSTDLFVFEGVVEFQNELGRILAKEMTYSRAEFEKAPLKPKKMREKEAPEWQDKVQVNWGFKLIPEKSGRQPVNTPLKIAVQVSDISKGGNIATDFSAAITVTSAADGLYLSADGSSWGNEITINVDKGRGNMTVRSKNPGPSSLVISSEETESRKLNLEFYRTEAQKTRLNKKVSDIARKKNLDGLQDKIEGKDLKSSKVDKGSEDLDAVLQKVDTGEYEIVDVITIQNDDGSVSVRLVVKPRSK